MCLTWIKNKTDTENDEYTEDEISIFHIIIVRVRLKVSIVKKSSVFVVL